MTRLLCPKWGPCGLCPLWPLPAEGPGADPRTAGGSWGQAATPAWPRRRPRRKHAGVGGAWGGEPGHPGAIGGQPAVWAPRAPCPASGNRPLLSSPTATGRPVGPCAGPTPHPSADPQGGQEARGTALSSPDQKPRVVESGLALQLLPVLTDDLVRKGLSSPSSSAWPAPACSSDDLARPPGVCGGSGGSPMVAGQLCGQRPGLGGVGSGDRGLSGVRVCGSSGRPSRP